METWILFALASAVAAGLHNFMFKIVVERNYDPNLINGFWYIFGVILMWIYLLHLINNWLIFSSFELFFVSVLAFFNSLFFNLSILTRVESMRNIDTVIFFPLYKTFWPILITCISIFIFRESLAFKEILWIVIWICVPLLLITKTENRRQKNLYYWVVMMLVTVILSAISASTAKTAAFQWQSIDLYVFLTFLFWMILSFITYKIQWTKRRTRFQNKDIWKFCLTLGVFHIASFVFFAKALVWNFAIVFTINSFSILIPIILSIIFYWEHFNLKKWIVIALSIVSILLFI